MQRTPRQLSALHSPAPRPRPTRRVPRRRPLLPHRALTTLAIETSCDDTSVAVLSKQDDSAYDPSKPLATLHFHKRITANNAAYRGIHPTVSLGSHERNLSPLIEEAIAHLPVRGIAPLRAGAGGNWHDERRFDRADSSRKVSDTSVDGSSSTSCITTNLQARKPDFISATRGPGMRASLNTGLNTAKGLALAWGIPLVGVHHMQAHALTPRLVHALAAPHASPPTSQPTSQATCHSTSQSTSQSRSTSHSPNPTQPTLHSSGSKQTLHPTFPSLTLLISGGHTLLLHSHSLTTHPILATTTDIAVGDAIDKIARCVLSQGVMDEAARKSGGSVMYGPLLEEFGFPREARDSEARSRGAGRALSEDGATNSDAQGRAYDYIAPATQKEAMSQRTSQWGWALPIPLAHTRSGSKARSMEFSFTGLVSAVERVVRGRIAGGGVASGGRVASADGHASADGLTSGDGIAEQERRELARESMRVAFEHLAGRVVLGLDGLISNGARVESLVVSGGVASNRFLRYVLREYLDVRGYSEVELVFPPLELCTDNAAMIGWAGLEMYEEGWVSEWGVSSLAKWSLDPGAGDGGVLGVGGWRRRESLEEKVVEG